MSEQRPTRRVLAGKYELLELAASVVQALDVLDGGARARAPTRTMVSRGPALEPTVRPRRQTARPELPDTVMLNKKKG